MRHGHRGRVGPANQRSTPLLLPPLLLDPRLLARAAVINKHPAADLTSRGRRHVDAPAAAVRVERRERAAKRDGRGDERTGGGGRRADGRTEEERQSRRSEGGGETGEGGRYAEWRADNAPCARGTTVSKQNRERARLSREGGRLPLFIPSLLLLLLLLLLPFFLLFFLSADDGADHRHFSEASRTTVPSRLL